MRNSLNDQDEEIKVFNDKGIAKSVVVGPNSNSEHSQSDEISEDEYDGEKDSEEENDAAIMIGIWKKL